MKQLDFLGIGDPVIDAFIKLQNAEVHCDIDEENCKICMNWGDKIPFERADVIPAVGNAANASVSAHRLGLESGLMAWIGDDRHGDEILEALQKEGLCTDYIIRQEGMESNYHYILRYGAERTILVKHHEYDYNLYDFPAPKWIYLSSLAENSVDFQKAIGQYVQDHPETSLAFQPGTFQIKLGYEALKVLYQNANLFFCNQEEAQRILETDEKDLKALTTMFHEKGVQIPIVTDGPNGAVAFDGTTHYKVPMYPDIAPPKERTGAGDSFSSTVTAALAMGEDLKTALSWGPINSMNVVQHIGAQAGLLPKEKILEYLENAPEDYVVTEI